MGDTFDRGVKLSDGQDYNHATDGEYKRLRDEADRLYQKRAELSRQSQQAFKQGDKQRAKQLSDESKQVLSQAEDKNFEAANYVFQANNADSAPDEIDLHGLYVKEAEAILQRRITQAVNHGENHLRVIVGKGLHSKNGIAKIKPAVDQLCDESGLKHYIDPKNSGVLVIELNPNSHVSKPPQSYQPAQQPQYHQQSQQQGHYQQQPQHNNNNDDMVAKIARALCNAFCGWLNSK
ncbi:hypothetical protein DIURU_000407 [Diutina rugosa]|uniref:Smr domain-containing protein n=1 Tax=Diutina rugosa TaxID=5481 RepID=A0A642UY68_DIURU|nr:uncharacterized protein DIURU_000407 [Diutina rugosa]KAA8907720.1 hypothetical protein DIURU_000407 [Diutina rugosa]